MLLPAPIDPAAPDVIGWRVGPGLVRVDDSPEGSELPAELHALLDRGILRSVRVRPGRIETTVGAGTDTASAGPAIRAALFDVLSRPGGWPTADAERRVPGSDAAGSDDALDPAALVRSGADRELEAGVREVLDGEFGIYTASHGGHVELIGVSQGVVTVALTGRCHGCAAAEVTLRGNLAARLRRLPGYVDLRTIGEAASCDDRPRGATFLGRLPGFRR
ncbi:NifU family protein [Gordonia sp. NPDC003504]